jgi:hypothetical protein
MTQRNESALVRDRAIWVGDADDRLGQLIVALCFVRRGAALANDDRGRLVCELRDLADQLERPLLELAMSSERTKWP